MTLRNQRAYPESRIFRMSAILPIVRRATFDRSSNTFFAMHTNVRRMNARAELSCNFHVRGNFARTSPEEGNARCQISYRRIRFFHPGRSLARPSCRRRHLRSAWRSLGRPPRRRPCRAEAAAAVAVVSRDWKTNVSIRM